MNNDITNQSYNAMDDNEFQQLIEQYSQDFSNSQQETDIKYKIIDKINKSYNIAIVTHLSPDGDAIGASVALALALESLNKKVDVIIPSQSTNFNILTKNINLIKKSYKSYDLTILLDCSSRERTIYQLEELSKYLVVIDHHTGYNPIGNLYLCEDQASTTIIIYDLILKMNVAISPLIATALYTGIIGDTSYFSNNNVTPKSLSTAAILLHKGADLKLINNIFRIKTFDVLKLINEIISNAVLNKEYHIIYAVLLHEDLERFHLSYDIIDCIMKELKNIKEAEIAFLFIESKNDTKIKVRSRGYGSMNKIMQYFNGGGHKYAAGASIDSINIYNIVDIVISRTIAYIDEHPEEFNFVHSNEEE